MEQLSKKVKDEGSEDVIFVYKAGNAHWGFTSYDTPDGQVKYLVKSYDKNGQPIKRNIHFSRKHRFFKVRKSETDLKGVPVWEYVKNHPSCRQSPFFNGWAAFEMLDPEGDASEAIKAKELRNQATNEVFKLDKERTLQVGATLGIQGSVSFVRFNLLEIADNDPAKIIQAVSDPELEARATVHQALNHGIFTKKGFMIMWNTTHLGNDETQAANKLADDKEMFKNVRKAIAEKLA